MDLALVTRWAILGLESSADAVPPTGTVEKGILIIAQQAHTVGEKDCSQGPNSAPLASFSSPLDVQISCRCGGNWRHTFGLKACDSNFPANTSGFEIHQETSNRHGCGGGEQRWSTQWMWVGLWVGERGYLQPSLTTVSPNRSTL